MLKRRCYVKSMDEIMWERIERMIRMDDLNNKLANPDVDIMHLKQGDDKYSVKVKINDTVFMSVKTKHRLGIDAIKSVIVSLVKDNVLYMPWSEYTDEQRYEIYKLFIMQVNEKSTKQMLFEDTCRRIHGVRFMLNDELCVNKKAK